MRIGVWSLKKEAEVTMECRIMVFFVIMNFIAT
jgi:hypothetical protein